MIRAGDILENKYRISTLIARGGSSRVWLAENIEEGLNKLWAVKELDPNSEIYKKTYVGVDVIPEVEILKKVKHHAFPKIVEAIKTRDSYAIVMDYIQGETLDTILKSDGPQDEETVVSWILDVCDALSYLHNMNPPVIYRDMKPDNIMLTPDGDIKVIDLNISRERTGEETKDTMPLGTTGYASPEHYTMHADARSDVFSTGVTLYALLTGIDPKTTPFLKPLTQVDKKFSTGLEKIILKATDPDPGKRYQSIQEMANAVESHKKLDDDYIANLKGKLKKTLTGFIASVLCLVIGTGLFTAGSIKVNDEYQSLVNTEEIDPVKRQESLEEAIALKPYESAPYLKIIDLLCQDGELDDEDFNEIFRVYSNNKEQLKRDSLSFAEVNFDIGEAYLKYYNSGTDVSTRAKLLLSNPYFENATYEKFDRATIAKDYCFMADYYKKYVMPDSSLVTQDATLEEYEELINVCSDMLSELSAYSGDKKGKLKIITSDMIINLIDSERGSMAKAGIEKTRLTDLISELTETVSLVEDRDSETVTQKQELLTAARLQHARIDMSYVNVEKVSTDA